MITLEQRIFSQKNQKTYSNFRIEDDIYIDNETGDEIKGPVCQAATGVKDMRGKMIYEGDCINIRDEITGIIISCVMVFYQFNRACFSVLGVGTMRELIDQNYIFEII